MEDPNQTDLLLIAEELMTGSSSGISSGSGGVGSGACSVQSETLGVHSYLPSVPIIAGPDIAWDIDPQTYGIVNPGIKGKDSRRNKEPLQVIMRQQRYGN